MQELFNKRQVYQKNELTKSSVKENPIEQFRDWYIEAENDPHVHEANAMAVATSFHNQPRIRMVLLKQYTWEGFIFFTNYDSKKGIAIKENPKVCLHFFWPAMERQIIIEGYIEILPPNLSDGYFSERPRGSQIGAIISPQSHVIPSKKWLENNYEEYEKKHEKEELNRPENWGGYIVKPYSMEFWQGRPNRLHDRIQYTLLEDYSWKIERLAP